MQSSKSAVSRNTSRLPSIDPLWMRGTAKNQKRQKDRQATHLRSARESYARRNIGDDRQLECDARHHFVAQSGPAETGPKQGRRVVGRPEQAVGIAAQSAVREASDPGGIEEAALRKKLPRFCKVLHCVGIAGHLAGIEPEPRHDNAGHHQYGHDRSQNDRIAQGAVVLGPRGAGPFQGVTSNADPTMNGALACPPRASPGATSVSSNSRHAVTKLVVATPKAIRPKGGIRRTLSKT
ncbi:hypothetical protein [Bradyrhizobium sp. BR 1433]|uniref:hypothetical protein n=1 Tax=Bradyrhizobium sp. BR 1433 TaxID=3447967 RepID=UPI003EE693CE